jgi:hypothetical protein
MWEKKSKARKQATQNIKIQDFIGTSFYISMRGSLRNNIRVLFDKIFIFFLLLLVSVFKSNENEHIKMKMKMKIYK